MRISLFSGSICAAALVGAFIFFPGSGEGNTISTLPYDDATRVAQGQELYVANCASCHGVDLEGQPNWRMRDDDGYLPAPPHDETGHTWHHDTNLLIRIVREGTEAIVGGNYKSNMPGYGDVLSEDDIINILAFIKSNWPQEIQQIHNEIDERRLP